MNTQRKGLIVFAIVCGIVGAGANFWLQQRQTRLGESGQQASMLFDQQLEAVTKRAEPGMASFRGRPVLINFWATWCAPCVKEMPALQALSARLAERGVTVIGLAVDSKEKAQRFLQERQIDYPVFLAGGAAVQTMSGLGNPAGGLPFTLLIDKTGKVQQHYLGQIPFEQLEQDLKRVAPAK